MRYPPGKYYYLSFNIDFIYIGSVIIDENTPRGKDGMLYFSNNETAVGLGEYERYGNGRKTITINKYHNLHPSLDELLDEVDPKNGLKSRVEIFDMLFNEHNWWHK